MRMCRWHQQVSAAQTDPCGRSRLLLRHLGVADVVRRNTNTTCIQRGGFTSMCCCAVELYCSASRQLMCVPFFVFFPSYRQLSVGSCTTDSSQVLKCPQLTVIRVRWEVTRAWLVRGGKSHFWSAIGCPECQSDHFCGNPEVFTFKVVESNDFSEVLLV